MQLWCVYKEASKLTFASTDDHLFLAWEFSIDMLQTQNPQPNVLIWFPPHNACALTKEKCQVWLKIETHSWCGFLWLAGFYGCPALPLRSCRLDWIRKDDCEVMTAWNSCCFAVSCNQLFWLGGVPKLSLLWSSPTYLASSVEIMLNFSKMAAIGKDAAVRGYSEWTLEMFKSWQIVMHKYYCLPREVMNTLCQ